MLEVRTEGEKAAEAIWVEEECELNRAMASADAEVRIVVSEKLDGSDQ